jgi:predicted nucleotidyltransferase
MLLSGFNKKNMNQIIIDKLQKFFPSTPIEKAWLFGSYARGEETEDSDVDVLYKVNRSKIKKFSLLDQTNIMVDMEQLLQKKVDLISDGSLRPRVENFVNKDKILIYERQNTNFI